MKNDAKYFLIVILCSNTNGYGNIFLFIECIFRAPQSHCTPPP